MGQNVHGLRGSSLVDIFGESEGCGPENPALGEAGFWKEWSRFTYVEVFIVFDS